MDKFIAFVDLEKAFDRIDRNRPWEVMSKEIYNIPEKLTRVVRSLYTKCTCKVKNNHMSTEVFEVKTGVRQ